MCRCSSSGQRHSRSSTDPDGMAIRTVFFPTRVRIAAQAAISSSQWGGGCREWDAVIILMNKNKRRHFISSVQSAKQYLLREGNFCTVATRYV